MSIGLGVITFFVFQSTLLQEERPFLQMPLLLFLLFQSTLLQEERLSGHFICENQTFLSIHAPTRGATPVNLDLLNSELLSIHAPTRGATPETFVLSPCNSFNPRSYKRSDDSARVFHCSDSDFQSTLLQEERQQKCTIFLMHLCNNYCIVSI